MEIGGRIYEQLIFGTLLFPIFTVRKMLPRSIKHWGNDAVLVIAISVWICFCHFIVVLTFMRTTLIAALCLLLNVDMICILSVILFVWFDLLSFLLALRFISQCCASYYLSPLPSFFVFWLLIWLSTFSYFLWSPLLFYNLSSRFEQSFRYFHIAAIAWGLNIDLK